MTPKSDHEDDMSMEEILASIRKFVTDNPPEDPQKQKVYKGDLSGSVVIPPAGHTINQGQEEEYSPQAAQRQPQPPPAYQPEIGDRSAQAMHRQSPTPPIYEPDILELKNPISPNGAGSSPLTEWPAPIAPARAPTKMGQEESIMTLINPIGSQKVDRPNRFSTKPSQFSERDEGLGSSHALAASASSLSRLAQASKSVSKKAPNLADQRDLTLDQLIQDLIRPMIKQWIDTHLSSLVEEMVAKEIKRITKHLE